MCVAQGVFGHSVVVVRNIDGAAAGKRGGASGGGYPPRRSASSAEACRKPSVGAILERWCVRGMPTGVVCVVGTRGRLLYERGEWRGSGSAVRFLIRSQMLSQVEVWSARRWRVGSDWAGQVVCRQIRVCGLRRPDAGAWSSSGSIWQWNTSKDYARKSRRLFEGGRQRCCRPRFFLRWMILPPAIFALGDSSRSNFAFGKKRRRTTAVVSLQCSVFNRQPVRSYPHHSPARSLLSPWAA